MRIMKASILRDQASIILLVLNNLLKRMIKANWVIKMVKISLKIQNVTVTNTVRMLK